MADVLHSGTSITGGHASAVAAGAAGFMTGADKTKLDGITAGAAVPNARTVTAGAGLTGGGDLSADRTLNVVANADATIVVAADDIKVGATLVNANIGAAAAIAGTKIAPDFGSQTIKTTGPTLIGTAGGTELNTQQPTAVQTTDATVTNIFTLAPPSDSVISISAVGIAHQTSDGDSAIYRRFASFKSNSGTVAQIGATTNGGDHEDAGAATWDLTVDVSSNTIRVRVTGQAATTIDWKAYIQIGVYGI